METCPCQSGKPTADCCEPLLRHEREAGTPEALMRARYTAYTRVDIPFIRDSMHPDVRGGFDEASTRAWAEKSSWKGLEIRRSETDAAGERGEVEFVARYAQDGRDQEHHEVAVFRKHQGKWFFEDGKMALSKPFVREEPKTGRNDPCPCGSGRKFKKCHGLKAA